eukprot:COSAG02_NODE_1218_length_13814_cov_250.988844_7_plen_559_part_00
MDAAQLTELLASSAVDERTAAYAAIEATADVALGVHLVAPLTAVLGRPEEEIGASEFQRAALALGHLLSLDCLTMGGEIVKDSMWLTPWATEANALNRIVSKPTDQLTRADALLVATADCPFAAFFPRCVDEIEGLDALQFFGGWVAVSPHSTVRGTDERNNRLGMLLIEILRDHYEQREQLMEGVVAGAYFVLALLIFGRPSTAKYLIDIGIADLAVTEMRTLPSSDWHRVSRCPSGRVCTAAALLGLLFLGHDDTGTPEVYDTFLEGCKSYAQLGSPTEDTTGIPIYFLVCGLYNSRAFTISETNAAAMRAAAPSIRFILDNPPPHNFMSDAGYTTGFITGFLATAVFGREEEGDTFQLRQTDVDAILSAIHDMSTGGFMGGAMILEPYWGECLLSLSVSDRHKPLLLNNSTTIPHLILNLFLDQDHPKGLRAKEVLQSEVATPTPIEVQQLYQEKYANALHHIALWEPGRAALLRDPAVTTALDAVAKQGMTEQAKEHARGALIALQGIAKQDGEIVPNHIMLSYNWSDQETIMRVNNSLKRRKYITWIDMEQSE